MVKESTVEPNAVVQIEEIDLREVKKDNNQLRICLVETNFHSDRFREEFIEFETIESYPFGKTILGTGLKHGLVSGTTIKMDHHDRDNMKTTFKYILEETADKKLDIICFPELMFPFNQDDLESNDDFFKYLVDFSKKHKLIIVAGSYLHTYNTCPVFFPGQDKPLNLYKLSLSELERKTDLYKVDALQIARDAGAAITKNTVMLGTLAATEVLPFDAQILLDTILHTVPAKFKTINEQAFQGGIEAIQSR